MSNTQNQPWTRAQIEGLKVGDYLSHTIDTVGLQPRPGARWSQPRRVVEITFRGTDVNGRAYVGFATEFGPTSSITGSIKEGEAAYRLHPADSEAQPSAGGYVLRPTAVQR